MSLPDDTAPAAPPAPPVPPPAAPPTPPPPVVTAAPPQATAYAPSPYAAPRPRGTAAGTAALIGAGILTFLYLIVKVIAAALNGDPTAFDAGSLGSTLALVFGVLGILAIVPAAFVVVLGHLGVRARPDGTHAGRVVAAIGLGAGYVHIVGWFTRILVALILSSQYGDISDFVSNIFWWA